MKKLISTMLVALLLISMVACGGENPKLAEAKEGFNSISTQFNEVATLMNENKDEMDAELIDLMNELSDMLEKYGDMLENGDSLNDEQLDAIIGWFGTAEEGIAGVKADIETILAAEDTFPEALADVEAYEIPDVSNTAWQLAGGMIDGVEMEQADLDAILAACGGTFAFVFDVPGVVSMYNGETEFKGTCETIEENYVLYMEFEGYTYYGVFTVVNDTNVIIIANTEAPGTALYMTQIVEG
ncbi:MAG: hypothetical protein IJA60_02950 [Clostridia bacterium]|nr:hypothetical protein [Clostridia bacterium]